MIKYKVIILVALFICSCNNESYENRLKENSFSLIKAIHGYDQDAILSLFDKSELLEICEKKNYKLNDCKELLVTGLYLTYNPIKKRNTKEKVKSLKISDVDMRLIESTNNENITVKVTWNNIYFKNKEEVLYITYKGVKIIKLIDEFIE